MRLISLTGFVRFWSGPCMDYAQIRARTITVNIQLGILDSVKVESMLLDEMDQSGRIMVRSLDKIHARTGLSYETLSSMANILQNTHRNTNITNLRL